MKMTLPWAVLVTVALATSCGTGGAAESTTTEDLTQEGPMSFEVPDGEGWEEVPVEDELPDHAWTMGFHYNVDETPKSLRIIPDVVPGRKRPDGILRPRLQLGGDHQ